MIAIVPVVYKYSIQVFQKIIDIWIYKIVIRNFGYSDLTCGIFLLAVAWCIRTHHHAPPPAAANRDLKKKILKTLPKLTYLVSESESVSDDCCPCLSGFEEGDEIRVLPTCKHVFHVTCIDTWFGSHSSGPSCLQILM
jgi:hypothetical protein